MSDRVVIVRGGSRRAGGFTLVDVMIALAVIAVGVLGMMSLLLVLRSRNESFNTTRHAVRACQEVLELSLNEIQILSTPAWLAKWSNASFIPRKVFSLDKKERYTGPAVGDQTDLTYYAGRVRVTDVSDPAAPGSLFEIVVAVDTTGLTPSPIKTSLVTRRCRP